MRLVLRVVLCMLCVLAAATVHAQVQAGSITGSVTDSSNSILPGTTVTVTGERLIGGAATQITDSAGAYRFDRLPPGSYVVKFELQGFRTMTRDDIRISAGFVATVNGKLEVGNISESITVTGESPTIDTKSNLQQTVMTQEILEGVPTGRDPWSLAKLIPGVQVATYDVGGTQSIQQSSLSSHGSNTNDVSYNIDGATVNWPGGGGGATMLYYDQGMFEEVNYMTSAIPAEVMAGGVSINMVTKDGGNKWKGNLRFSSANSDLQSENHIGIQQTYPDFLGNPTLKTYDLNLSGGGSLKKDRLWVNGTIRKWVVNKLTNAKNDDGTQALDDNDLKNYSGKLVASLTANQKASVSYLWNNKIRGHRRDTPPDFVPDIAALVQTNPASTTQAKYTGIHKKLVYESSFSVMDGQTNYGYQPGTPPDAIRVQDGTASTANFAANRHEEQPNSRYQFDNVFSVSKSGLGGEHLLKGGAQWARLYYESNYSVQGNYHLIYTAGRPTAVREFNTPADPKNIEHMLGFFVQDAWSVSSRLTLNLGMRYDLDTNGHAEKVAFLPWLPGDQPHDTNNIQPRIGVNYRLDDRTSIRGGYGLYFAFSPNDGVQQTVEYTRSFEFQALNDGRPDFLPNWFGSGPSAEGEFGGRKPTEAQALALACDKNAALFEQWRARGFQGQSPCILRSISQEIDYPGQYTPYSHQASVGVQRQIASDISIEANYVYTGGRGEEQAVNANLNYNPATGANYPFTDVSHRPFPQWGQVYFEFLEGWSNYHGTDVTLTKRFSHRWQATASYTLGFFRDAKPFRPQWYIGDNGVVARREIPFALATDMGGEYGFAGRQGSGGFMNAGDQRHRAVINGIWQVGRGLQVSGIYFFGSGERFWTDTGLDLRDEGSTSSNTGDLRLRADGSIVPRNSLVGRPIHKVDLRLQQRLPLLGRVAIDGIVEVFNLFNHENFGSYVTNASNANFGQPSSNSNAQYFPRVLQFGLRATF
jgi:hypothetical protein